MNDLRRQAISGVKWTSSSTVFITIFEFVKLTILARLLMPIDFGLMGMLMVFIGFAQTFADLGISNAIIHKQEASKEQLSSLYWLNIIISLILFVLLLWASQFVADYYREPRLKEMMLFVALVFPITAIGQQFQILYQKELNFKIIAYIEIWTSVISGMAAIYLAYHGQGVYSLIWSQLITAAVKSFALAVMGWKRFRPSLVFKLNAIKGFLNFGLYQMGSRSVNYFSANVDYLFIGRYLGADLLGIYTLAYKLVVVPLVKITPNLTRVAFPVFSKKQNDDVALNRGYLEVIKVLAVAIFPVLIGIAVTAPVFIPVIYGIKWTQAIPLIQILAVVGIVKALGTPTGSILLAKGHANISFYYNLSMAILNSVAFWFAAQISVVYVSWCWFGLSLFYFVVGRELLYKVIRLTWGSYIKVLIMPLLLSIAMGGLVFTANLLFSGTLNGSTRLLVLIFTGVAFYSLLLLVFERRYLSEMVGMVFHKGAR
jgi:O-antigen/teichoic acid export membrane protein